MNISMLLSLLVIVSVHVISTSCTRQNFLRNHVNKYIRKCVSSLIVSGSVLIGNSNYMHVYPVNAVVSSNSVSTVASTVAAASSSPTLQDQLELLQLSKTMQVKSELETNENAQLAKQLQYPDNKLVATGVIVLDTVGIAGTNKNEKVRFPYGFDHPYLYNSAFDNSDATMFILAVGREGPPLAAKRVKLNTIQFPYVFEITSDDLLFPYTPEAYAASPNSKDTIAVTTILSPGPKLSIPNPLTLVSFGLSEPVTIAGKLTRGPAKLEVSFNNKVDTSLYTPTELQLLGTVDVELDKINPVLTTNNNM